MNTGSRLPSPEEDWLMLEAACRVAPREKIAAWCRDGMVTSRVALRVSRIRDLDTGTNDTISNENVVLDPTDWASNALGNPNGPHWRGEEARFDFGEEGGLPLSLNMTLVGGALYQIEIHSNDLMRMLATAPPRSRVGRPAGGGYQRNDKPIIEKMRAALANGDFTSPTAAALHFANEADGGGTLESKAKRLVTRFITAQRN